jgi:uncharacterized LabA/DUF88 family protein
MNRFIVLVDAGYLLSQSVQALSNMESRARKDVEIHDPAGLISMIVSNAAASLGNQDLLRVYWYDGVFGRMSAEQEALALLPDVQLRQGIVNRSGVQKGIDSKMMADLMELSANQAISDAVLVTGDGDLVIGIEWAQRRGIRVALMGVEEPGGVPHNQSFEAVCMADRVRRISKSDIAPFLRYVAAPKESPQAPAKPAPAVKKAAKAAAPKKKAKAPAKPAPDKPTTPPKAAPDTILAGIADQFIETAVPPFTRAAVTPTGAIGQAIDGKLLQAATAQLGRKAMPAERTKLRKLFRDRLLALPELASAEA